MSSRKFKLNKDKTSIVVVDNPLQIRNLDYPSNFKLDDSDFDLSIKFRNLRVVL